MRRLLCAVWLLFLVLFASPVRAQINQPATYWQHDAAGRILQATPIDITKGQLSDFLVLTEGDRLELVSAAGQPLWEVPITSAEPITAVSFARFETETPPEGGFFASRLGSPQRQIEPFILVASASTLTAYRIDGTQAWTNDFAPEQGAITQIEAFDSNGDGRDELLVTTADSALSLYRFDTTLSEAWRWQSAEPATPVALHITADALLYITQTAADIQIVAINPLSGQASRNRTITGRASATTLLTFANQTPSLAIGTESGDLHLLNSALGDRWIPRTLQFGISSLATTVWLGEPILLTGTETGKLIGWRANGSRLWDKAICPFGDDSFILLDQRCPDQVTGRVTAIETQSLSANALAPLAVEFIQAQQTHILLLDQALAVTAHYPAAELPIFVDTNQDQSAELAFVNFATLALNNPGTTVRNTRELWQYRLGGQPRQSLNYTRLGIGRELLIAAGQSIHLIQVDDGTARWVESFDGDVTQIKLLTSQAAELDPDTGAPQPDIRTVLVGYTAITGETTTAGYIELVNDDGDKIPNFRIAVAGSLTAVALQQRSTNDYWLVAGTSRGFVYGYRLTANDAGGWEADFRWRRQLLNPVEHIALLDFNGAPQFVIATDSDIRSIEIAEGITVYNSNVLPSKTSSDVTCSSPTDLLFVLENGLDTGFCLNDTVANWREKLGRGKSVRRIATAGYLYTPLNQANWLQQPVAGSEVAENQTQFETVTDFVVSDLTGNNLPDVVLSDANGDLLLDLNTAAPKVIAYSGAIVGLETIQDSERGSPGLAVVAGNSLVHFLRFLPDYPPLLAAPAYDAEASSVQVTVQDIEQSPIEVILQLFDQRSQSWVAQGEPQIAEAGNTRLTWSIDEPTETVLQYRFVWRDGDDHAATWEPPIIAVEPRPAPLRQLLGLGPLVAALLLAAYLVRLFRQPDIQARFFYRRLQRDRQQILPALRVRYESGRASADWLIHLANSARRRKDTVVANLADGLFLLDNPSNAGLPILSDTLQDIAETQTPAWREVDQWQQLLTVTDQYLKTPTVSELSLLQPELESLLRDTRKAGVDSEPFPRLQPLFKTLTAAESTESVDDRLLFLEDALVQLRDINGDIPDYQPGLPRVLVEEITERWLGLISAETEAIRGRARVTAQLISTQIMPSAENALVLELHNSGRAVAENVRVQLEAEGVAVVGEPVQLIPALPSNRSRRVAFPIVAPQADTFRAAFTIQYNDRMADDHEVAYANIVNMLQLPEAFEPVINPYAPGTPLQQNSAMFFGRTTFFNFIAEQAPRLAQQRVLILVGQRRTGKTSALLRLGRHLPSHLIPIYIDCQSLGALPGEAGLFQDLVWLVEDALLARNVDFVAPVLDASVDNPLTWFKRTFIPAVREAVSAEATLVLVFDEFESFENLVDDGILPRAIFGHLRHLMQHCEGVSFVFVGTHRLEEMTTGYWSVLFNIALYKAIDYLNEGEASALITQPVAPQIRYDPLALERIWRITAGHPYFLQLVCYSLIKRANNTKTSYITVSDVEATIDEMLALGEVHFAYIWQRSDAVERIVLVAVSHLLNREEFFRAVDVARVLEPYGVRLSPVQLTGALDHLVQRNIMEEVTKDGIVSHTIKIGLIGTWVERTRSLSRLYSEQL